MVAGGVRARTLAGGQALIHNPDILSSATTLQQSGAGGFFRLVDALQQLDNSQGILALVTEQAAQAAQIVTINNAIANLQTGLANLAGTVSNLEDQITAINTQITTINGQITALQTALGGYVFGAVGGVPPGAVTGSIAVTEPGGAVAAIPTYA